MNKNKFRVIKFHIVCFLSIVLYLILEHSTIIPTLIKINEKGRYSGFLTFLLTGLFKYGLLTIGVSGILILTVLLIKKTN